MKKTNIKLWELSLLTALCFSLIWGSISAGRQAALEEKIIRLHVIASGDSPAEQALKMEVKEAFTAALEPLLEGAESSAEAESRIRSHEAELLSRAAAAAGGESLSLQLGRVSYPLRYAEGYALPAGNYLSLRLSIGEGRGHNWWGVIFPQLDVSAPEDALEVFSDGELRLIFDEDGREVRFKLLEILQMLKEYFR